VFCLFFFFFQAEDGIRDFHVTGVQTCALPIFTHLVRSMDLDTKKTHSDPQLDYLRVPPHSVEAEQSVLGGLLLDNAAFDRVTDRSEERRVGKEWRSRGPPEQ